MTISTLAGPDGRLFGSITPLMIANQLEAKGYDIERPRILFDTVIKELGNYEITVDAQEVKAKLKIDRRSMVISSGAKSERSSGR